MSSLVFAWAVHLCSCLQVWWADTDFHVFFVFFIKTGEWTLALSCHLLFFRPLVCLWTARVKHALLTMLLIRGLYKSVFCMRMCSSILWMCVCKLMCVCKGACMHQHTVLVCYLNCSIFLPPPHTPPMKFGWGWGYIGITVSICPCVWILTRQYLLKCPAFCNQTLHGGISSWAAVPCRKIGVLTSRSRLQWGFISWKYDCFYRIFWTADPFATRLGLMIHHYKPECLVRKLDRCVQSQGQDQGECLSSQYLVTHWTFCGIMSLSVMQKDWCTNFKVKVTMRACMTKYDSFYCVLWTADLFAIKLTLMVWHHKL